MTEVGDVVESGETQLAVSYTVLGVDYALSRIEEMVGRPGRHRCDVV